MSLPDSNPSPCSAPVRPVEIGTRLLHAVLLVILLLVFAMVLHIGAIDIDIGRALGDAWARKTSIESLILVDIRRGLTDLDWGLIDLVDDELPIHLLLTKADKLKRGQVAKAVLEVRKELGNRASVHEVGLMDLFDISRLSGTFPQRRALIGVQPKSLDWGEFPSTEVAPAIARAAAMALTLADRWRQ